MLNQFVDLSLLSETSNMLLHRFNRAFDNARIPDYCIPTLKGIGRTKDGDFIISATRLIQVPDSVKALSISHSSAFSHVFAFCSFVS